MVVKYRCKVKNEPYETNNIKEYGKNPKGELKWNLLKLIVSTNKIMLKN